VILLISTSRVSVKIFVKEANKTKQNNKLGTDYTPVILATQEAGIRKITFRSQP
jgi:hypothetical protein